MRKIIVFVSLCLALAAAAINITNYPVVTTFDGTTWFLLSSVPNQTNYNLPGTYVASAASLAALQSSAFILNAANVATGPSNTFTGDVYVGGNILVTSTNPVTVLGDVFANSLTLSNGLSLIDFSKTNAVVTNAVALKVPVLTNGSTVFYFILFTNVP